MSVEFEQNRHVCRARSSQKVKEIMITTGIQYLKSGSSVDWHPEPPLFSFPV